MVPTASRHATTISTDSMTVIGSVTFTETARSESPEPLVDVRVVSVG